MRTSSIFCTAAAVVILGTSSLAQAGSCSQSAAHLQREVDATIEDWIRSGPWQNESIDALRGRQATPRSIASATTGNAAGFENALDALDRARAAGSKGDDLTCDRELVNVRAELRRYMR